MADCPPHDGVCDPIRVALVHVPRLADAARRHNAPTLEEDVGGFVGGGVQVRLFGKGHAVARGVRRRADLPRGLFC